jgi:hypothetical protein
MNPPSLSPYVIKNLGVTFCKLDSDLLSVENLSKVKKGVAAPGGEEASKKEEQQWFQ